MCKVMLCFFCPVTYLILLRLAVWDHFFFFIFKINTTRNSFTCPLPLSLAYNLLCHIYITLNVEVNQIRE